MSGRHAPHAVVAPSCALAGEAEGMPAWMLTRPPAWHPLTCCCSAVLVCVCECRRGLLGGKQPTVVASVTSKVGPSSRCCATARSVMLACVPLVLGVA